MTDPDSSTDPSTSTVASDTGGSTPVDDVPVAVAYRRGNISPVWFIPFITLLIAAWLGYRDWQATGPTIDIFFSEAPGVKVGKTELLYKNVKVGKVTDVRLEDDLQKVRITAEMDPVIDEYLTDQTKFWLVSPRIGLSGVSGLNTLLSGVYIELDPSNEGKPGSKFVGLDTPPTVRSTDVGTLYHLNAETFGSLNIGSPVYYRQVMVGAVTNYQLEGDGERVQVSVFINEPFDKLVKPESRFWNVSGFGFELNAQGIKANLESLTSLVAGGVAFATPEDQQLVGQAPSEHHFHLYTNEITATEASYTLQYPFVVQFEGNVRGLAEGAPVEFRGIKVGRVEDVYFSPDRSVIEARVVIEPQRIDANEVYTEEEYYELAKSQVENGLKAQLKSGNLLTGALYIDLVMAPQSDNVWEYVGEYPKIPTLGSQRDHLMQQLGDIVEKMNRFPIDELGSELTASVKELNKMLTYLEQQQTMVKLDKTLSNLSSASGDAEQLMKSATAALEQSRLTLQALEGSLSPDSELYYRTLELIDQMNRATHSFKQWTEDMNRNPNQLLFGKEVNE